MGPHLILGIGELLWDILPAAGQLGGIPSMKWIMPISSTGDLVAPSPQPEIKRVALLGGAPANFTVMAGRLGNHAAILSRIGRDRLGRMAVGPA